MSNIEVVTEEGISEGMTIIDVEHTKWGMPSLLVTKPYQITEIPWSPNIKVRI